MRLKTEIYVSALVRRVFALGGFAAVERKGAEEAGAVFIRQRFRDGTETLYGPAPQAYAMDDDADAGRHFEVRLDHAEGPEIDAVIERERKWDSDLWVLELEIDEIGELFPVTG